VRQFITFDRQNRLSEGLVLSLRRWDDVKPAYLQEHVDDLFPEGVSSHGELYFLRGSSQTLVASPAIELIWEYVRRVVNPSAPSRLQSVFGFDLDDEQSASSFSQLYGGGQLWIVEAEHSFRADMTWLTAGSILRSSHYATCYWQQMARIDTLVNQPPDVAQDPMWEVLLTPPVRVVSRRS